MKYITLLSIIVMLICMSGCEAEGPEFDENYAFGFIEAQCELGPRPPGSAEIELCRTLIIDELEKYGARVTTQEFVAVVDSQSYQCKNIMAKFPGHGARRLLLGAHYDTRPWADKEADISLHQTAILGANDGASGVAVLMGIARLLADNPSLNYTVEMVFFDMEDMGSYGDNDSWCLGSTYFANNYQGEFPDKVIVVDMVGDKDLAIKMEKFSYARSSTLTSLVWSIAREAGIKEFKNKIGPAIKDDHLPLIEIGMNAIDIIDFEYEHWHKLSDTPENCSAASLGAVGDVLVELIYDD